MFTHGKKIGNRAWTVAAVACDVGSIACGFGVDQCVKVATKAAARGASSRIASTVSKRFALCDVTNESQLATYNMFGKVSNINDVLTCGAGHMLGCFYFR